MAIEMKQVNTAVNTHIGKSPAHKSSEKTNDDSVNSLSTPPKSDSVSLTAQAQKLQSTQAKMTDIPEINEQKVQEIKLAIAEGRYKIDPEKLATNIAQFENDLKGMS
ncbi:anti-sigma-28 factor, FlgM family [Shewanella psychrophila]|uniref:Negative regulator of flagellin synthesis n=1 Tax=Shewanella psychrophila TaxID=225848 RepID=A0A1S6HTP2_9GAMM|nr:flagellar biosynthesis anti-sigma factor FlgM [Shewanella psychrophila]AQS38926.1 anti-sigma-28 factor, FlgM family [Shewanella psychrophila]